MGGIVKSSPAGPVDCFSVVVLGIFLLFLDCCFGYLYIQSGFLVCRSASSDRSVLGSPLPLPFPTSDASADRIFYVLFFLALLSFGCGFVWGFPCIWRRFVVFNFPFLADLVHVSGFGIVWGSRLGLGRIFLGAVGVRYGIIFFVGMLWVLLSRPGADSMMTLSSLPYFQALWRMWNLIKMKDM